MLNAIQRSDSRPPVLAIADLFLAQMHHADHPEEAERVRSVVLLAGQHLADHGQATNWSAFNPETFFHEHDLLDRHELIGYGLILVGLMGWLATIDLLANSEALALIDGIAEYAPAHHLIDDLRVAADRQLGLRPAA